MKTKRPEEVETKIKQTVTIEYASHCMRCQSFVDNKTTSFSLVAGEGAPPATKYDSLCKKCAAKIEKVARNSRDK